MNNGDSTRYSERIENAKSRTGNVIRIVGPGFALAAAYSLLYTLSQANSSSANFVTFLQSWVFCSTSCIVLVKLWALRTTSTWFMGGETALFLNLLKIGAFLIAPLIITSIALWAASEIDKIAHPLGTILLMAYIGIPVGVIIFLIVEGIAIIYLHLRLNMLLKSTR